MENKLWLDIQAQGENLPAVVNHLYTSERRRILAAAAYSDNDRPFALIGVASAQYMCMPAASYLNSRGRFAATMCASDALYNHLEGLRRANVIINSRSGETVEIVRLAQALKEQGIPFAAITNEPESTLAGMADRLVWANTRKDELVSINVVTGMMLATLALASAVVGEFDAQRPSFEQVAGAMAGVVRCATEQAGTFQALLGGARPIYLLYRGASAGAAYCGRLALEEIARWPGVAMGAAEFRQGPNETVDQRFGAVVFAPGGAQGELNRKLAADIRQSGGQALLVGSGSQPDASFAIPDLPDFLRPVLEVVPVQLLAFKLAKSQGYEPGTVRYITKVITTEEGIPNQS